MEEYIIKRVSEENYKDIAWLFRERGVNYSEEFVRRKFNTGFTGKMNIGFIAYDSKSGEPASHYSVFPCFMQIAGKKVLVAQSGDTITHERHQRKGLFVRLAEETFSLSRNEGFEVVYGFPNDQSYHGFVNRLNWIHSENFHSYEIPVRTFPLQRTFSKLRLSTMYESFVNVYAVRQNKSGKRPSNSVIEEGYSGVVHDVGFFRYKTYTKNYFATVENVLVWFKIEGGLSVGDIQCANGFDIIKVENALKKLSGILGCEKIRIHASPGTRLQQALDQRYASSPDIFICWLSLNGAYPKGTLKFTAADMDTF